MISQSVLRHESVTESCIKNQQVLVKHSGIKHRKFNLMWLHVASDNLCNIYSIIPIKQASNLQVEDAKY